VLGRVAHLEVVPKTGSQNVDVAVPLDPDPVELATVARVLPRHSLARGDQRPPSARQHDAPTPPTLPPLTHPRAC